MPVGCGQLAPPEIRTLAAQSRARTRNSGLSPRLGAEQRSDPPQENRQRAIHLQLVRCLVSTPNK
jgi:hypothetical protein